MNKVFVITYIVDTDFKRESRLSCVCAKDKKEAEKFLGKQILKDRISYYVVCSIREIEYGEVI